MLPIFLFSCHRKAAVPDVERGQIDSVVYSVGDADSLARVMESFRGQLCHRQVERILTN